MEASEEIYRLVEESRSLERQGDISAAIRQAQQAHLLAHDRADCEGEAAALNVLAYAHIRLGHYDQSRQFCRQALALAGAETSSRVDALLNLGICAGETDDLAALEDNCAQAIDLSRQIGYQRALVRGLHMLACMVYMPRGQFVLALAIDEEALKIAQAQNLLELAWGPLLTMSYVHWLAGQRALARARLAELRQAAAPGSLGDGYWHYIQANLALEAGEVEQARHLFTATLSIAESNGIAENLFLARLGMSRLYRFLNEAPTAQGIANSITLTVQQCTFIGNSAYRMGGAIYLDKCVDATITQSQFHSNTTVKSSGYPSADGGAIYSERQLMVEQSAFFDNFSAGTGGAIATLGELNLVNSTFYEKRATVANAGSG